MKRSLTLAALLLGVAVMGAIPSDASPATPASKVVITSGPAFTTRSYSCTGPIPNRTRRGDVVRLVARLESYSAVLSGTAMTNLRIANPRVSVTTDGITRTFDFLASDPATLFGLAYTRDSWRGILHDYPESAMCIARLGSSFEPTVIVPVATLGMHCCTLLNLIGADGGISNSAVNIGNPAAVLVPAGKGAVLITGDNAFAYTFTDFARSAFPLRVLKMASDESGLVNVTREWPHWIALDAAFWKSLFNDVGHSPPYDDRGVLAAWAADECELGRCSVAFHFLNHLNTRYLAFPAGRDSVSAYIRDLRAFLASHGYIRR